jgi:hypothetical protein
MELHSDNFVIILRIVVGEEGAQGCVAILNEK